MTALTWNNTPWDSAATIEKPSWNMWDSLSTVSGSTLKSIFVDTAMGFAVKMALRTFVTAGGLSGFCGIAAAATLSSVVMTGFDIRKDFVQARDNIGSDAAWDNLFSWESAATYSKKFGIHMATSAVGATAAFGVVEALDTPMGQAVKNLLGGWASAISGLLTIGGAEAAPIIEEELPPPESITGDGVQVAVVGDLVSGSVPAILPEATIPAADFDPANIISDPEPEPMTGEREWPYFLPPADMIPLFVTEAGDIPDTSESFRDTLVYAEKEQLWAVKETAHNFFNGVGVEPDYAKAYEWAMVSYFMEQEANIVDGEATKFINDMERIADVKGYDLENSNLEAETKEPNVDVLPDSNLVSMDIAPIPEGAFNEHVPVNDVVTDGVYISEGQAILRFAELSDRIGSTEGWSDRALEVLSYAEKGQDWALKELAHNLANAVEGVAEDDVLATEIAQISADMGHESSRDFVNYMIAHNDFENVTAMDDNTIVQACWVTKEVINDGLVDKYIECAVVDPETFDLSKADAGVYHLVDAPENPDLSIALQHQMSLGHKLASPTVGL